MCVNLKSVFNFRLEIQRNIFKQNRSPGINIMFVFFYQKSQIFKILKKSMFDFIYIKFRLPI